MSALAIFTRRPMRRIALLHLPPHRWQAVVAGPDNRLAAGFGQSGIYTEIRDVLDVARGMHQRTGLPLDLSVPIIRPRPRGPGDGERIAA